MEKSNALVEIQAKYQNCNLLIPSATSVQLNPFYKVTVMEVIPDTSENTGDIFNVGKIKTGEDKNGKAVYEDTYSLAKPLLMKLATAAGIQFHPEYTTVIRENQNTYCGKAYGAIRLPDGTNKTHAETKRICLDDEEAKYRLEFFDKSILGIKDWRAAKAASEMFAGEWKEDPERVNQWGKPEKYFLIAEKDREKYIERSVLVNMTLLRKTASEKAQTGAILRVIRALLGIKGNYTLNELTKPFAVPTVTFSPDYSDNRVRQAMLVQGMNSMANMFGTAALPTFGSEVFEENSFDVSTELDNPAFLSDGVRTEPAENDMDLDNTENTIPLQETVREKTPSNKDRENLIKEDLYCDECGISVSEKIYTYSIDKFGKPLCMNCQRGARR